jgi:hypothetical protein
MPIPPALSVSPDCGLGKRRTRPTYTLLNLRGWLSHPPGDEDEASRAVVTRLRTREQRRHLSAVLLTATLLCALAVASHASDSQSIRYKAPAGTLPATLHIPIGNYDGAVLPNGRFVTPVGAELPVGAPKPFGLAVSADGSALATVNIVHARTDQRIDLTKRGIERLSQGGLQIEREVLPEHPPRCFRFRRLRRSGIRPERRRCRGMLRSEESE